MVRILELKTEHTIPFKTIFEVLKDVLSEVTITIEKNGNAKMEENRKQRRRRKQDSATDSDDDTGKQITGGMKIMTMDSTQSMLIHMKLEGKEFAEFKCGPDILPLGINLAMFNRALRILEKEDTLTIYVDNNEPQIINIQAENPDKGVMTSYRLKLMDLNNAVFNVPSIEYEASITMNSSEFHKLCREMSQIAEYVEIKCTLKNLSFTCKGDCAERTSVYFVNDNGISISFAGSGNNKLNIIQGIYELKNFVLFTKCSNLCNDIQIFMKNDYPLAINYQIATLGKILLCMSPITQELKPNYDDD